MTELYDTLKHKDLVFDIGMHKGEDAEFYLRKGFRVVAFEADPDLVQSCSDRLKEYVDKKQLIIVAGAIVGSDVIRAGQKWVPFYRNNDVSVWGTVSADWAQRNARLGHSSTSIQVDVVDFSQIMQRHGVPHYMKIDIEGSDMVCVNALSQFRERPDYLSIESGKTDFAEIKREIEVLTELGYASFLAIEQSSITRTQIPPSPAREGTYIAHHFPEGSSGLFGLELQGEWKSRRRIVLEYLVIRLGYFLVGDDGIFKKWNFRGASKLRRVISRFLTLITRKPVPGWYDTHARLSSGVAS
jgi:FkbM family methyltransferase